MMSDIESFAAVYHKSTLYAPNTIYFQANVSSHARTINLCLMTALPFFIIINVQSLFSSDKHLLYLISNSFLIENGMIVAKILGY